MRVAPLSKCTGLQSDRSLMFRAFVLDSDFPCVAARAAVNRDRMHFASYSALGDVQAAAVLCEDLATFADRYESPGPEPVSFVAMFEQDAGDESQFVSSLWRHLQFMHDGDALRHGWDPLVSADPGSDSFSFSVAGRAFFIVGLSPSASRLSRRAPFDCLVFNFHDQFEWLKAHGRYESMQRVIRRRDLALQGSLNPSLAQFGEASEARQYAGDDTGAEWVCPFQPRMPAHAG